MRIVSMLASGTEILAALGAQDDLVARSHECDWPDGVQSLPVVTRVRLPEGLSSAEIDAEIRAISARAQAAPIEALSPYAIDQDLLRALRPDVIITQTQCQVCAVSERDVLAALAGITDVTPLVVSLAPYRLADLWEDIQRVGDAIDRSDSARSLIARLQNRLAELRDRTSQRLSRPRVAMLEWTDPLMAAGNWMPELVAIAGGDPLFGRAGEYSPLLDWADLVAADPDVIVIAPCGFTVDRTRQDLPILHQLPGWSDLRAVREHRVFVADGNAYFNRSGPRLVESAEILAAIFAGDAPVPEVWERM